MMRKIFIILLAAMLATSASAQFSKVGSAGAQFLKIDVGSRYQAMGGAGVSTAQDVYATYWNPAGLANIESSEISFTNVNWALDVSLNYIAYARYFEDVGTFGASVTALSMGEQEIYNYDSDQGTGTYYSTSSYAAGISFARRLTTRFSFGATVKYVTEKIHLENASGWAFDLGTQLETGFRNLRVGMSITNMGADMQFEGPDLDVLYNDPNNTNSGTDAATPAELKTTPYNLPLLFRMGAAYDWELSGNSRMTVAAELHHPNDHDQQGAFGAELGYDERYFLRGGYKVNFDEEDLALGAGIIADVTSGSKLVIDYSWQDMGRLQSSHRFSIGFSFY